MIAFVAVVISILICNSDQINLPSPVITVDGWSAIDDFRTWNTNLTGIPLGSDSNSTVFVVPSSIGGLSLMCNATYPIEWSFHREKWGRRTSWQTMLTTSRESDPSTLEPLYYTAELRFLGSNTEITGNYTCQRYAQPDVSKSVYVYWEGSSPPYLTLLQSGNAKRTILNSMDTSRPIIFRLPCTVSRPDITVDLLKFVTENTTVPLPLNDSIKYDPAIGFTIKDLPYTLGHYKCSVGDLEDHDALEFEVIKGDDHPKPEFEDQKWGNAMFEYDSGKRRFVCCSSSKKPPKIGHYYCNHPISCKLRKHALANIETSAHRLVNGSCTYLPLRVIAAGVLRCVGDSIDVVREYFFPILNPFQRPGNRTAALQPYYSWSAAEPDKMMSITNLTEPFYIGQKKRFDCQVSPFYFSQGMHWAIKYQNETTQYIKGNQTKIGKRHAYGIFMQRNHAYIQIQADEGLQSITCHAPEWNTTDWKTKTLTFDIKKPIPPSIGGPLVEEQNWKANETDKNLTCTFQGLPRPYIYWKKDNKTIYRGIKSTNTSTTLTFARVGLEMHGTYSCNVSNVGGNAVKVFKVYVSDKVSAEVIGLYIFAAVCVIGASIGAFFGFRKMNEQKESIRKLANVAFKEVTDGIPTQQTPQQQPPTLDTLSPAILPTNGTVNNGFLAEFGNDGFRNEPKDELASSDFGRYQKM